MINKFEKEYRWLSNFYPALVFYEGDLYTTIEHAYQASKTDDKEIRREIRRLSTPGKAKRMGRKIEIIPNHDDIKLEVMKELLIQKFLSSNLMYNNLQKTKGISIVEENNWHDNIWGNCICEDCFGIHGHNYLGRLIMEIRNNYKGME